MKQLQDYDRAEKNQQLKKDQVIVRLKVYCIIRYWQYIANY